jgi:hypothetical protein
LDEVSLKKIFQEVVYSTLGDEYMDINLATTTQRTYGNVIEDIVALILLANCGVSVPEPPTGDHATNSKKDLIDSLAKNILTYEIAHIRKAYLEKLMWTIPAQDSSIYNEDYYQKYKYNICTAHPILSLKEYIQMRHHKKCSNTCVSVHCLGLMFSQVNLNHQLRWSLPPFCLSTVYSQFHVILSTMFNPLLFRRHTGCACREHIFLLHSPKVFIVTSFLKSALLR